MVKLRPDAQRNREKILSAAVEVFREHGAGAPLDLVTKRAGVGRGTLYRHFAERGALIAALVEMRMTALEEYADSYAGDDLLEHLLVGVCELQLDTPGLMTVLRGGAGSVTQLDELTRRTARLLSHALAIAHRAGVVRSDIALVDVLTTVAMVDGVINAQAQSKVFDDDPLARALRLTLRALRSPERESAPLPRPDLWILRRHGADPSAQPGISATSSSP